MIEFHDQVEVYTPGKILKHPYATLPFVCRVKSGLIKISKRAGKRYQTLRLVGPEDYFGLVDVEEQIEKRI